MECYNLLTESQQRNAKQAYKDFIKDCQTWTQHAMSYQEYIVNIISQLIGQGFQGDLLQHSWDQTGYANTVLYDHYLHDEIVTITHTPLTLTLSLMRMSPASLGIIVMILLVLIPLV